jgi:hypothetical protein
MSAAPGSAVQCDVNTAAVYGFLLNAPLNIALQSKMAIVDFCKKLLVAQLG